MRNSPGLKAKSTDPASPFSRAGSLLVLIAIPLVTCNALRASENVTYGDIPLAVGAVLLLAHWLAYGQPKGSVPHALPMGAILLLAAGLLAIVPAENTDSLFPTLRFGITLGVMPFVIMLAASRRDRVERLIDLWLLGAAANALIGALDVLGMTAVGLSLTSIDFVRFTDRAPGLTTHPNHLGLVTAMALPMTIARLGTGGRRGFTAVGLLPLLIVGVAVSGSRGAFMAAIAGALLCFLIGTSTRRPGRALLLIAAPMISFVILMAALGSNELTGSVTVSRLGGGGGATQSDHVRLRTVRQSLEHAVDHPFVGEGFHVVRTAHNIYIQLFEAGGLLALLAFLWFATSAVGLTRRLALRSSDSPPWLTTLAAGSGASICVWLLYGIVGNAIYDRYLYIPVGVALALSVVQLRLLPFVDGRNMPPTTTTSGFAGRHLPRRRPEPFLAAHCTGDRAAARDRAGTTSRALAAMSSKPSLRHRRLGR